MTLSRLVLLFLLATLIATTGCSSYWARYSDPARMYYRVRVTNPRGELIADYIAENRPSRTERGYRFKAVERLSSPPYQLEMRYPRGRTIEVAGPNIVVTRCGKPLWLYHVDGF